MIKRYWAHTLPEDYHFELKLPADPFNGKNSIECHDNKGRLWFRVTSLGRAVISAGYASDGCSFKWSILDLFVIGTPDGVINHNTGLPITYDAFMKHDVLRQFQAQLGMRSEDIDLIFYKDLKRAKFALAKFYYFVVRVQATILGLD